MSLYTQFKTDESLEKTGILLEYGTNDDGEPIRIRIARAGGANKRYDLRLEAEVKPHRRAIQTETIDKGVVDRLYKKLYAETVVLGWENVDLIFAEDGKPDRVVKNAPFNVENCVKLFNDLPDLFQDIQVQAQKSALFRAEILEADAKN